MAVIVTIESERYLVDVGYGSKAPFQPVPMKMSHVDSFPIIGTRRGKLEFRSVDLHTDPSQRVWVYSMQENAESQWVQQYAMMDQELGVRDYEVMNYFTSTHPKAFFVQNVVLVKLICSEVEGDNFAPKQIITLFRDQLRFYTSVDEDIVIVLASEDERVAAIEQQFGIKLSRRERESIRGYTSAIAPKKLNNTIM